MKNTIKKIFCLLLCISVIFSFCSCSGNNLFNKKQRFQSSFLDLFDTASTVIAYDSSEKKFDEHYKQFKDMLGEYDKLYDIYKSYDGVTNLYTVNKEAKDGPVRVDKRIIDMLEFGKYAYEISGGKTNICFGSVLKLWHDCRTVAEDNPENAQIPDKQELIEAAKHTDINDLVIDKENSTVYFSDPELQLDVGAIAKGYAVEEVCKWAEKNLWTSAAISIGGNVTTIGFKNDDGSTLWNIGIENPDSEADDYLENVAISNLSVVTSGDYQRYYTVDGEKYCHIVSPETLYPAQFMSAVSVICEDSALGDALSTTLFNMTIEDGKRLIDSMDNVEAVWVDKSFNKVYSNGFEQYIMK